MRPLVQPLGVAKPPRPLALSESRLVIYPKVTSGGFEREDRPVPLSLARRRQKLHRVDPSGLVHLPYSKWTRWAGDNIEGEEHQLDNRNP